LKGHECVVEGRSIGDEEVEAGHGREEFEDDGDFVEGSGVDLELSLAFHVACGIAVTGDEHP
jgi:hypothetical protein